ncbi:RNA polymerase sigma-70 factor [Marinifilum caeruleilacunae]|uniref:RNA polymerase sigma-70 factor n=1 Tax=Marinifilum caeruleilacunae TaxID=2499076 RepID=A0ABX1WU24_9BACT|nr:RNA polymerase sigma-70 factor [Marinifilum caeruleilacunae]NOU59606.1 RNA polymerase sigma-70 factor [Marinifilum caeruleilacunae]
MRMKIQEQNIIQKLKGGKESGLREMFDLYYTPLCVFALKYIDDFDEVEDLVQDIFVGFWEKKRVNNLTGSLKSYLFTSVRNNALSKMKKENRFCIESLNDEFDLPDEEADFDKEAFEIRKQGIYKEIEKLPSQSRKVFELIIFSNYPYDMVAQELNISLNTVKTHFSRALKKLRSSLGVIIAILLS